VEAPKATVPKKAPEAKPAKKVKVTEYWIQVASFKDRYQAENTAKSLETQGLKGTLTTATVAGQPVVRVRVGPYTNEAEAGKFLAWLKPIKEYENSYVTKAVALRAE
jgi:cell division protein FtsN